MKKGLVLATIFALCSTMMVSAKEFNDARWQWFYSNANYTGKVDLNTLSYDPSTDTATAWAVWVRTNGHQDLMSYIIYFKDNSMDVGQYYIYQDGSDAAIVQDDFNGQNHVAAPGSGDEAQARAEEKAQLEQAQQEARIVQQKEAERKAKHERNRSIIKGIFGI